VQDRIALVHNGTIENCDELKVEHAHTFFPPPPPPPSLSASSVAELCAFDLESNACVFAL
jgi:hypothetical protein